MNDELWRLYSQLQTTRAYGSGLPNPNPAPPDYSDLDNHPAVWDYPLYAGAHVLLIGPGGVSEVNLLTRFNPESIIAVLTMHEPEVAVLQDHVADIRVGDIHDIPYCTGTFDYIFAANVLEHTFAPYIALMECRRVLRPGGSACFIMPSFRGVEGGQGPYHLHCLTEEVWGALLAKVGLDAVGVDVLHGRVDKESFYMRFRCVAAGMPEPHVLVQRAVIAYKRRHHTECVCDARET